MKTLTLNKNWTFRDGFSGKTFTVDVPGLNVAYLVERGIIPDPRYAKDEKAYSVLANFGFTMTKVFTLTAEDMASEFIEIRFDRLDTLCEVYINGQLIAFTRNIHRKYTFDIKPYAAEGENTLEVRFLAIKKYIEEKQSILRLPKNFNGTEGHPHIRKCACHFGWDFAASLNAQGIGSDCTLILRKGAAMEFIDIRAALEEGKGTVNAEVLYTKGEIAGELTATLTCPDGKKQTKKRKNPENKVFSFEVEKPEIWWCNGLGEQPLYTLSVSHKNADGETQTIEKRVAFRTITLDRERDEYGSNFQFVVNGVPIFAKGANYIPMDTIYTNITSEKIYTLLKMCKDSGMNMVRVWGGGFYESDEFYDIADELGILLWQDCAFACCAYPLMQEDFLEEVKAEIEENVRRLRHHACLALWCGNNEIESMSMAWLPMTEFITSTGKFFYETLDKLIKDNDGITPYHPTSPSSGKYMVQMNSDSKGDTHIWDTWHGYRYKEFFDSNFTRFCSEFGMQSYPHEGVTPHQKCDMGEERLRFYLTKHFALQGKEKYKIYFTQLIQMEYMKYAVEHLRRNSHRCHGALYWQLNDCHHSASWSALDFLFGKKALMYHSKHFYEAVHPSALIKGGKANIFVSNDMNKTFEGTLTVEIIDTLSGKRELTHAAVSVPAMRSLPVSRIKISSIRKSRSVLVLRLFTSQGTQISENRVLLCENKDLALPKPHISYTLKKTATGADITFKTDAYARYIFMSIDGEINSFSDNFFDLSAGEEKTVSVTTDNLEGIESRIKVISLYEAMEGADRGKDFAIHTEELFKPMAMANIISRLFEQ